MFEEKLSCFVGRTKERNEALDKFLKEMSAGLRRRAAVAKKWNAWVEQGALRRAAERQEKKNKRKSE